MMRVCLRPFMGCIHLIFSHVLLLAVIATAFTAQALEINISSGSSIQEAINSASAEDTIAVVGGVYRESLIIDKPLTLLGTGTPTIDACGGKYAVLLLADGIRIEGFNLTNSSNNGIYILSDGNVVASNIASGNGASGIALDMASNNTICNNTLENNGLSGISLERSDDNLIQDNAAIGCGHTGVDLKISSKNRLFRNRAFESENDGIELTCSNFNILEENLVSYNKDGICLEDGSKNNTIAHNNASLNEIDGFLLRRSNNNTVCCNYASRNYGAIFLEASSGNQVSGNIALDNLDGIHVGYDSRSNRIFWNLLDNSSNHNAYDESGDNWWDNGTIGNYYGDRDACSGSDGMCSSAYKIPGGLSVDYHPLDAEPDCSWC